MLPVQVPARDSVTVPLPADVTHPDDAACQVLVVQAIPDRPDEVDFARAVWHFAEVVDQALDPDPVEVPATRIDGGYRVTVTARSLRP